MGTKKQNEFIKGIIRKIEWERYQSRF